MTKIAVLILTYNNKEKVRELIKNVLRQTFKFKDVIVIDNGSEDNTYQMIKEEFPEIKCLRLRRNIGSEGGFYCALKHGKEKGYDFLWLLDDDIILEDESFFERIWKKYGILFKDDKVAVLGMCRFKPSFEKPLEHDNFCWGGAIIRVKAIERAGLPVKEFFLYGGELEYAYRLKYKFGYKIFILPEFLSRRSYAHKRFKFLGREFNLFIEPHRIYYEARNMIYVEKMYRNYKKLIKIIWGRIKAFIYMLLFFEFNTIRLFSILQGIIDGLRGKLGIKF